MAHAARNKRIKGPGVISGGRGSKATVKNLRETAFLGHDETREAPQGFSTGKKNEEEGFLTIEKEAAAA